MEEPYVRFNCDWEKPPVAVGPDEYYVVGDNRSMPWRYHDQGCSKRWRIFGRLLL
jgi:hypothetical protein